jgi:hypothetical protein
LPIRRIPEIAIAIRWSVRAHALLPVVSLAVVGVLFVLAIGNLTIAPEGFDRRDAGQYLTAGLRLSNDGYYGLRGPTGYHRREPVYPATLAVLNVGRAVVGLDKIPVRCGQPGTSAEPDCHVPVASLKAINVVFLTVAALAAAYLVMAMTGFRWLAALALFCSLLSAQLVLYSNLVLTEALAACLMTLTAVFSWLALDRGRTVHFLALGATLAALVLTKVIFAYLWVVYLLIFAGVYILKKRPGRLLLRHAAAFALPYLVLVGGWMIRNALTSGHFELVEHRSYDVLSIRAAYDQMTADEFLYGFVYHTPNLGEAALKRWGVPEQSYRRFAQSQEYSFRRIGMKDYAQRMVALYGDADGYSEQFRREQRLVELFGDGSGFADSEIEVSPGRRSKYDAATRQIAAEAVSRMRADPVKHLRASIALAYRGVFPETGLGWSCSRPGERLAAIWGIDWPCWHWNFSPSWRTAYNIAGALSLLAAPLLLFLTRGGAAALVGLAVFLPALYAHAAYAIASHFIVRYAVPEIALRNVAVCAVVGMLIGIASMYVARNSITPPPSPPSPG